MNQSTSLTPDARGRSRVAAPHFKPGWVVERSLQAELDAPTHATAPCALAGRLSGEASGFEWSWPLMLLSLVCVLWGCRADSGLPERGLLLSFEVEEAASVEGVDKLVLWVKREEAGERVTLDAPVTVDLKSWSPDEGPAVVEVVPGQVMKGELQLFAVMASSERVEDERWRFGAPMAVGVLVFDTEAGQVQPVVMRPYDSGCDLDGDYFQSCQAGGACCPGFEADARFVDCFDVAPTAPGSQGRGSLESHPFQDSALDSALCGNGIDEDCLGGDALCDDEDGDGVPTEEDCDDGNAEVFPGAPEICGNGVDEDCDGLDVLCAQDNDGDGYFTPEDCNDGNPDINPGVAFERSCDGLDEDCDGLIDEGLSCNDLDGDGVEDDADCVNADLDGELPGAYDAGRAPGREEICGNGVDEDCDGVDLPCPQGDGDGDGFIDALAGGRDCNDADPFVNPDAAERCGDGIDNDCRGGDIGCTADGDGDGFNADVDCDDADADIHPDHAGRQAVEICDAVDNNCDGVVDEGNPLVVMLGEDPVERRCGLSELGICQLGWSVCSRLDGAAGIVCADVINPEAEICNGLDEDCDGAIDNGVLNACGGCAVLSPLPGAPCGPCGDDNIVCDGIDAVRCSGSTTNACGGCAELPRRPNRSCGPCDQDRTVCDGQNNVVCDGATTNECGSCGTLNGRPGDVCGPCGDGRRVCQGDRLVCQGRRQLNDCGGCEPSDLEQGDACGQCGEVVCQGQTPVCQGAEPQNDCGGCQPSNLEEGDACGQCGEVVCQGQTPVCQGPDTQNDCGGCEPSNLRQGDACGQCGVVVCQGQTPVCQGAEPQNDCGGCEPSNLEEGDACGQCGEVVCQGQTPVCQGPDAQNACGGCEPSDLEQGDACGQCGEVVCQGQTPVCQEADVNACGGCEPLDEAPGQECAEGCQWRCDGQNDVRCTRDDDPQDVCD